MKKYVIYILGLAFFVCSTSCKKFLAESSQDEIKPTTTDELAQLLYSDAYPYRTFMDTHVDLLTDDIQCNRIPQLTTAAGGNDPVQANYLYNGANIYTWNANMFDQATGIGGRSISDILGVNSWQIYYSKIKGCNVVLDNLDNVSGSAQIKNGIKGQALFLRAYYYLKLVTLYGQPYNGKGIDPAKSLGVPLILKSAITDTYPARNTLTEVYSQIETDLLQSADLLKNNYTPATLFRVSYVTAYALLSRLYLYMGRDQDMDKVITYATDALNVKPQLTQLTTYFTTGNNLSAAGIYDQILSQEILWSYGTNPNSTSTSGANSFIPGVNLGPTPLPPPFSVSATLTALYDKGNGSSNMGDIRYSTYLNFIGSGTTKYALRSYKIGASQSYGDRGMRVAELYLNRAEAYIRRFTAGGLGNDLISALADLNTLRQSRYDTRTTAYVSINITDPAQLFKFCQDERRRELCLEENHRWVDIKRWGLSITHNYIDDTGGTSTFTLNSGALIYALPIPYDVVTRNYNLQQNPR